VFIGFSTDLLNIPLNPSPEGSGQVLLSGTYDADIQELNSGHKKYLKW